MNDLLKKGLFMRIYEPQVRRLAVGMAAEWGGYFAPAAVRGSGRTDVHVLDVQK